MNASYLHDALSLSRLGGVELILALGAFFDDAGTHDDATVVVWAGFVGTADQWEALDVRWNALLDKPYEDPRFPHPPLRKFHLFDCQYHLGEFTDYSEPERDRLQRLFREIIADSGVVGIGYAVDRAAFNRIVTGDALAFFGDAESLAFGSCFQGALQQAREFFPQEIAMGIVFDRVAHKGRMDRLDELATRFALYDRKFGQLPQVGGISFEEVVKYTALQAADIIATENAWAARAHMKGKPFRPHFRNFLEMVNADGFICGEEEIRDTLRRYGFTPAS
jgi:hypothetical protein